MSTTEATGSQFPSTPGASAIKNMKGHSCILWQQRKVKCDRKDPCSACSKAHVECIFRAPAPPRRRKRRSPEVGLLARLKRYEELLKSYGAKIDNSNGEGVVIDPEGHDMESVTSDDTAGRIHKGSSQAHSKMKEARSPGIENGRLVVGQGRSRYLEK